MHQVRNSKRIWQFSNLNWTKSPGLGNGLDGDIEDASGGFPGLQAGGNHIAQMQICFDAVRCLVEAADERPGFIDRKGSIEALEDAVDGLLLYNTVCCIVSDMPAGALCKTAEVPGTFFSWLFTGYDEEEQEYDQWPSHQNKYNADAQE